MKKKIIAGVVIVILLSGFISLLPRKVKYQETVTACTYAGETLSVQFDVELWKYLWIEDEIHGSITVEDTVYVSERDQYPRENYDVKTFFFSVPTDSALERSNDRFMFYLHENRFEKFYLIRLKPAGGTGNIYFGPAETEAEAKEVAELIW